VLLENNSMNHLDFVDSLSKCNDEINTEIMGFVKSHGGDTE
jgi:hypothetical protein